jgi:hypothetical protein
MSIFSQNTSSAKSSFIISSAGQSELLSTTITDLIIILNGLAGTNPVQSVQSITDYITLLKKQSTSTLYVNIIDMLTKLREVFISFFPINNQTFESLNLASSTYLDVEYNYRQYIATGDKKYLSSLDPNLLPLVLEILDGIKNNTVN